ncbi:MAG TPA: hypothetical protein VD813_14255, partial [Pseudonocardia sp.]|nr:hypothetical protein [Pseudonocardia sp.]
MTETTGRFDLTRRDPETGKDMRHIPARATQRGYGTTAPVLQNPYDRPAGSVQDPARPGEPPAREEAAHLHRARRAEAAFELTGFFLTFDKGIRIAGYDGGEYGYTEKDGFLDVRPYYTDSARKKSYDLDLEGHVQR